MKKKLEAELISIAHRILKLKNKSELHQLHQEAQNLYEKLSVLRFVEENFSDVKPTIGRAQIEDKIEIAFETKKAAPVSKPSIEAEEEIAPIAIAETEEEVAPHSEAEEEKAYDQVHKDEQAIEPAAETEETQEHANPVIEAGHEEVAEESRESEQTPISDAKENFKPAFELSFDTKDEEIKAQIKEEIKKVSPQITFDDLLGPDYVDPVFVKPEDLEKEKAIEPSNVIPIGRSYNDSAPVISINNDQTTSINDRVAKGIIIGLNDRIAFMNHLFANSSEDYNRVLSQLMTFDSYDEAKNFIDTMVKPDYNNWEGNDEYAERFMEIVEKRFL